MNDAPGDEAVGQYMLSQDHRITFMGKPRVFLTRNDKEKSAAAAATSSQQQHYGSSSHRRRDEREGGSYQPPVYDEQQHRGSRDNYHDRRVSSSYDDGRPGRRDAPAAVVETRFDHAQPYDDPRQPLLPPPHEQQDQSHSRRHLFAEDDTRYHHHSDSRRRDYSDGPYEDRHRDNHYYPPGDNDGYNNQRDERTRSHHHDVNRDRPSYHREESYAPPIHNGDHRPENGVGGGDLYPEHQSNSRGDHHRHHGGGYHHDDDHHHRSSHNYNDNGGHDGHYHNRSPPRRDDRHLDSIPHGNETRPPHYDDRDKIRDTHPYYDQDHGPPTQRQPLLHPHDAGGDAYYPPDERNGQRPPSPPPPTQFFRPASASPSAPPRMELGGGRYQPPPGPTLPSTVVILENLPFEVTAREISVMLSEQHGLNVRRCTLEYDGEIGQQYALVTFGSEEDVLRCLELAYRYLLIFRGQEVLARREGNGANDVPLLNNNVEPSRNRDYPHGPPRPLSPPQESSRPPPLPGRWISAQDAERRSNSSNNRFQSRNYHPRGDGRSSERPNREQRRDRPY